MTNVKKIFLLLIVLSVSAFAVDSPVNMLESTANQMIVALKDNRTEIKRDPTIVEGLARKILLPHVDVAVMSHLALGRNGWNSASAQQRQSFTNEFITLLIRTYPSAFAAYRDEKVQFYPIRGGINNQARVQVKSVVIQQGGPSIPIDYRLVLRETDWKVYDINVDGVSMIQSFQSQFANEIAQGGVDGLIAALHKHNTSKK